MNTKDTVIIKRDAPLLVRFEPSLKLRLHAAAEHEGMSAAAIVRMAVRAWLTHAAPKKAKH